MAFDRFRRVLRSMRDFRDIRPCGPWSDGEGIWVGGSPTYLLNIEVKRWDVAWIDRHAQRGGYVGVMLMSTA
jgi:hypothetical protein